MNLSVALITHNEANDLPRTLNAVRTIADEIVIVDSGSTDDTPRIASEFGTRFFVEEWKGFGRQKNSLIDKCLGKWILLIDADEELSPELCTEVKRITQQAQSEFDVYSLRFLSYCFAKAIRHGGWSGFFRIRLFRNGAGRYNEDAVHEKFITNRPIGKIAKDIHHHTYANLEDYMQKFNHYTSRSAEIYFAQGKKGSPFTSSVFHFVKAYVLKLGFLDGYEGYLLAQLGAMEVFVKYSKLRELRQRSIHSR